MVWNWYSKCRIIQQETIDAFFMTDKRTSDTQLQEGQRCMRYDLHIDQHFHLKRIQ